MTLRAPARAQGTIALLLLLASVCRMPAASIGPLPEGKVPAGKTLLIIQPHHDDHTWQYGFGGLIAKMTAAGYKGVYVRVSNDEKDGGMRNGWGANDIANYEDTIAATKNLGIGEVISLNWRNDHMSSIPDVELRDQLIVLIRKHRPDVVMSYHPWGNYDRNPDHRKVAWAVGSAVGLAGFANVRPDHEKLGLKPHHVPFKYYSHRNDYGRGYHPNVFVELSEDDVARKALSYRLHKIRVSAGAGRRTRELLDARGLKIPELEGLSDEQAHERLQEMLMYWISSQRGQDNGVRYAEVFYFMDEWHGVPGLENYIQENAVGR
ncbi:MAG TPA: PIG-L family deacetylase [Bryobacterales bacterium]|nr:PIG-L family deacetylase [Bryobacterales bacterium]